MKKQIKSNNHVTEHIIKCIYKANLGVKDIYMEYKRINENIILLRSTYLRHIDLIRFRDNKIVHYGSTEKHLFKIMESKNITIEQLDENYIHLHFTEEGVGFRFIVFHAY